VTTSPFSLVGQRALVTGGGTGLGLGIACCLAAAGARVAVSGRREAVLREAVAQIGNDAIALPADVSDSAAVVGLAEAAESELGPLDILVNNAGNHVRGPSLELSKQDFVSVLDVHLTGAFDLTRRMARGMVERERGSIVFVGSLNAIVGMPQVAAYAAAKAAVGGLVRQLAVEWATDGVRVNGVMPGWIDAGMAKRVLKADEGRRERALRRTPLGRLGRAEDVGCAVVYLCSPAASFVTGTMVRVDGGAAIGF
jgi:NAD(P)-dependent dehydrogenase (short-subunit alcohol dehydrogenase family)